MTLLVALCLALAATAGPRRELKVAAAADLKFAMDEVVHAFARAEPSIAVAVSYGSSGNFFAQISNGAPFDVYLSADAEYPRRLAAAGLTLRGSEFVYGFGRIVLWVPAASPVPVERGLAALADPGVRRVAIANPRHAPYGRAAEAALRRAGLLETVRPKLVLGENVAQAAQFVESGAADAGVIALSLALAPTLARAGRSAEVPPDHYPRLEQAGVILARAREPEGARAFRAFVLGAEARAILARYGFLPPGE